MKNWVKYSARVAALFMLLSSLLAVGQVAVTTYHNDNSRRGLNANETILMPSNVNEVSFGKRLVLPVTGFVYAQPLYVPNVNINGTSHNVVYVATEHDQVYAFDANTGQQLWQKSFIGTFGNKQILPVSTDDVGCGDIRPEIGITGTPVIDLTTNEIYVVAKTKEIVNGVTTFYQRMHVLDIRTGTEILVNPYFGAPITAKTPGTGAGSIGGYLTFNPRMQNQREALALANGLVFVSWGSHCDVGIWHGYVIAFSKSSLHPSGVYVSTPNGYGGGIWSGGWGPAIDANNSVYLSTGNGDFDVNVGGIDYGDSLLRLSWAGVLPGVADYFTPWDQRMLGNYGEPGSGGIMLLPDQPGAPYPHLLVEAGKEGTIDLVNRDNMGHYNPAGDTQIVQTLPYIIGGVFGGPAMWNNNIYFGSIQYPMEAFYYDPVAQQIQATPTSATPEIFKDPDPPTPSVSANGTSEAIVWIIEGDSYPFGNQILRAYEATNLATELYNSNQNQQRDQAGGAVKFSVPTVADGMVFVGALNEVDVYGLLN